jgi:hypothetical protein
MTRCAFVSFSACLALIAAYLLVAKWGIHRETYAFYDHARNNRPITVELSVRRDRKLRAIAGSITLPVAIVSHGNTVKFTEYSFLANYFATHGYLVLSIQHDIVTDEPLATIPSELYVGRTPIYERGVANILFAIERLKSLKMRADFDHLTLIGHSNGGDISLYFAKVHPAMIRNIVTLDNLRVPYMTNRKFRILALRSDDSYFKPDPGVLPDSYLCKVFGIRIVQTGYRHIDMSDRGPDRAKRSILILIESFLREANEPTLVPEMIEPDTIPEMTEPRQIAGSSPAD